MSLYDLLVRADVEPELVLAMRHTKSKFRDKLWARPKAKLFVDYQKGQGSYVQKKVLNKKYIASFVGHEPGKAILCLLACTVLATRRVCQLQPFTVCQQIRSYWHLECIVAVKVAPRYWIELNRVKRFEYLESSLVIRWTWTCNKLVSAMCKPEPE